MFMFAFDRLTGTRQAKRASAFVAIALAAFTLPAPAANVAPTNLPATFCDDVIAGDLVVNSSVQIDTDTSCDEIVGQAGASALCVLRANNVSVTGTGSISFIGSRPAVLSAQGNLTILGPIMAGSGSDLTVSGVSGLAAAGGGGAGGGTSGGTGGSSNIGASGGSGGAARGNKALHPLIGGAKGAFGGGNQTTPGGGGGGALQLVACHTLTLGANVIAGGLGGPGGQASSVNPANGGGGGGSGGGLLLEGDAVTITADLIANGGGGGGGGTINFPTGNNGGPGSNGISLIAAAGGLPGSSSAGMGGNGGASSGAPGVGSNASTTFGAGGGGGGAAGRIRINFCNSASSNPSLISPAATLGISCSDVIFRDDFERAS